MFLFSQSCVVNILFSFRLEGLVMSDVVVLYCLFFQELIDAPAGKLHTGRSRNDQVCLYNIKTAMTAFLFGVAAYVLL